MTRNINPLSKRTVLLSSILSLFLILTGCFEGSGSKSPEAANTATVGDSNNRSNTGGSQVNQVNGAKASSTKPQNTLSGKNGRCFVIENKKLIKANSYPRKCWETGVLKIPEGIEVIGEEAFSRGEKWRRFTQIILPEGVKVIEKYAIPWVLNKKWQLPDSSKDTPNVIILPKSLEEIHEGGFAGGDYDMPTVVKGLNNHPNLRVIGKRAFADLNIIGNLKVPSKLEKISEGAFYGNNIEHIEFPETIQSIGHYAFGRNQLKNIDLPKQLEFIGYGAFSDNKISSLKLPDLVVEVQNRAFANNSLKEVVFNKKLTKIGLPSAGSLPSGEFLEYGYGQYPGAFRNNQLTKVVLPKSVEIVFDSAFQDNAISELIVEKRDGVLKFGESAFSNNQLKSLDFSDFYLDAGYDAFSSNQLTEVTFPIKGDSSWCGAFSDNPDLAKLSIPVTFHPFCAKRIEESVGKKLSVNYFNPIKSGKMTCPSDLDEDFVFVPGLKGFNKLDGFCVMRNQEVLATRQDAINHCQSLNQKYAGKLNGYEFDLISNYEWQIIAGNLSLNSQNWVGSGGDCKTAEHPCSLNPQFQMGTFDLSQPPVLFGGETINGLYDSHSQWVKDLYSAEEMVASGLDFATGLILGLKEYPKKDVMRYSRFVIGSTDLSEDGVLHHKRTLRPQYDHRILSKHFLHWGEAPYIAKGILPKVKKGSLYYEQYNCRESDRDSTCRMGRIYVEKSLADRIERDSITSSPSGIAKMQVTRGGDKNGSTGPYNASIFLHSVDGKVYSSAKDAKAGVRCVLRKK